MPEAAPLVLTGNIAAEVLRLLHEWGAAHDSQRRAAHHVRRLTQLDSPHAQHERLTQQELVEHHECRMRAVEAALTRAIAR